MAERVVHEFEVGRRLFRARLHDFRGQLYIDVREFFENSPIRLSQIMLEVTERQPLENLTETRRIIAALQGMGLGATANEEGHQRSSRLP